jgi:hypothetical protein
VGRRTASVTEAGRKLKKEKIIDLLTVSAPGFSDIMVWE